jgi:hypothetical protein
MVNLHLEAGISNLIVGGSTTISKRIRINENN